MSLLHQGQIVWFRFAGQGRMIRGPRPALVIRETEWFVRLAPITGTVKRVAEEGASCLVQPTPRNGLRVPSVVLLSQELPIDKRLLAVEVMGELDEHVLAEILRVRNS
jgi:mRNA-degrading endonuclease toxin of MazEF toxin-antitoxin module